MLLSKHVPFGLLWLFWAVGILQIDKKCKIMAKIVPIPFWCYYFGIIIKLIYTFDIHVYEEFTDVSQYVDKANNAICFISMGTNLVLYYKRGKDLDALFEKMTKISLKIQLKKSSNPHCVVFMVLIFLSLIITSYTGVLTDFEYQILFYLPILVSSLDNIFIDFILKDLRQKFMLINYQCKNKTAVIEVLGLLPKTHISEKQSKEELFTTLEKLSHLHYHLVQLVHEANRIFGTTTLWNTAAWFSLVINQIYYMLYLSQFLSNRLYSFYVCQFPYVIYQWAWIYFQIWSWSKVQNEADKTVVHVHNIWNIHVSTNGVDDGIRHLQLTVLRMLNTKLDLSARGFFPLKRSFLSSVVSAVVTYVLILIQFEI